MNLKTALLLTLLSATAVQAHSWYDARCCSGHDCHPVPCGQLKVEADGSATFLPTERHVFKENVLPSQDGDCHLCTSQPKTNTGYAYCAYIVQGF